ncbi:MAG: DNA-protecting protein DprA [Clostridiales bacterium]|nr:MAG: DNA-protecting protein DprA [Clostridiales bacterium]
MSNTNLRKLIFANLCYSNSRLNALRSTIIERRDALADEFDLAAVLKDVDVPKESEIAIDRQLNRAKQCGHSIIGFGSEYYPYLLSQIADFPLVLYCRGNMERLKDEKKIAVVGSRKPTYDGKKMCDMAARYLAKWPYTVVSGLAYGIDSLAHRGALSHGCPTIAVLANPVDEVMPHNHINLAKQIIAQEGLIVSETPYFERTYGHYYVRRNRIVSGMCQKVFIVEGARKSGSMTTAQHALDQNRELYAMPGSICNVVAGGTNNLIKNGAHAVIEAEDLFIPDERPERAVRQYTHPVAQLLMEDGQMRIEKMSQMMDIPIHILLSELTILECQDILKVTGNMVTLVD